MASIQTRFVNNMKNNKLCGAEDIDIIAGKDEAGKDVKEVLSNYIKRASYTEDEWATLTQAQKNEVLRNNTFVYITENTSAIVEESQEESEGTGEA